MTPLLVVLGGMLGAPLRYLADAAVGRALGTALPWGTLVVNVVGSAVLGIVAGAVDGGAAGGGAPGWLLPAVGTGLCGALTTFSTFSQQTLALLEEDAVLAAVLNAAISLGVGLVACGAGWLAGAAILAH